jgi:hypothetical protein
MRTDITVGQVPYNFTISHEIEQIPIGFSVVSAPGKKLPSAYHYILLKTRLI